jgi:UDP-3-O-[3-hydroxymyristoyl] glucosamine N-acyltransferase
MTTRASTIAEFLEATLHGDDLETERPRSWTNLAAGGVTFAKTFTPEMVDALNAIPGVLVIAAPEYAGHLTVPHIVVDNPRLAFAQVVERFFTPAEPAGVSPLASISPAATIGADVTVGPFCVIGDGVRLGPGVRLRSHVVLTAGTSVGDHTLIKSNTVIGEEGFGFERGDVPVRVPHSGGVRIGAHVEIGALCSIARGTLEDTVISDHVKIDDHVFIAHNVRIGRGSFVIAGAEISGSVELGDDVWVGPQATIRNQVRVGAGAMIGMGAVVTKDVPEGVVVMGSPAKVIRDRLPSDG